MTVTFRYTPQLLQRAHELHYKKFFPLRGRAILFLGLFSMASGIVLLFAKEVSYWLSIPLIIYGVTAVAIHYYHLRTLGKRAYKKLKEYHDPFTMTIDDEVVGLAIHGQAYSIPWSDLAKALVSDEMVLLYPNDSMFFIFPKSQFRREEYDAFREMVRKKIEKVA